MYSLSIVIPCYNEESRLPFEDYVAFLRRRNQRLLFVNDGSTDGTLNILRSLEARFPEKVSILNLPKNVGKAEAVRLGMLHAANEAKSDIIGFMDADLATPFEEISHFLEAFRDSRLQFVFGARIARIGANIQRYQARHYFGRIVATVISNYLVLPVNDSQCGAKFFRRSFAVPLFSEPFVSRWLFDVEIFRRMLLLGIKVESCTLELPLNTWIEKGASKLVLRDLLKIPTEFYKIIRYYSEKRNILSISVLYQDLDRSPTLVLP